MIILCVRRQHVHFIWMLNHTQHFHSNTWRLESETHPVSLCRWTVIQPHPERDPSWSLFFKRLPHDPCNANFPSSSVPRWTGVIWQSKWKNIHIQFAPCCYQWPLATLNRAAVFTFQCPSLLSWFGRMRAVDPAVCFTSQEGLFDAEGLTGGFGGGFRPAAGSTNSKKTYTQILTLGWHTIKMGRYVLKYCDWAPGGNVELC